MYIHLSRDALTVVQRGLVTAVGPEDRRTPRMLKEPGDTIVRLLSGVSPSSRGPGERPMAGERQTLLQPQTGQTPAQPLGRLWLFKASRTWKGKK